MNNSIPSWTYKYDIDENRNDYIKLINKVFDSGRLLFGEELENFQEEFAKYIGVKYGIGCDNATNGLFLALKSIGIEQDDEVITVPNTAIPTISAIRQAGAKPVFVDINNYGLMDINELEKSINKKTKAIMPVHLYGFPCDIKRICEISKIFKIPVIEDCSQAHGSEFDNKKVGSFGDLSVFSFYPTKSLGGFGDAGMICTNNQEYSSKLKKLRFYGIDKNYTADIDGYNSRMDEIHAAILRYKLKKLDKNISERGKIANYYKKHIKKNNLTPLNHPPKTKISNYLIPFLFNGDRDKFQQKLLKKGIGTNVSYKVPIHLMPAYLNLGYKKNDFPKAEEFCNSNISLPIFDNMPEELPIKVVEIVNQLC